jgi:hypothetical protein
MQQPIQPAQQTRLLSSLTQRTSRFSLLQELHRLMKEGIARKKGNISIDFVSYNKRIRLCAPGKQMGILFLSMDQEQSKKPDQYGLSLNPEYGATNNCTNLHMSLPHQSVLVEVIEIPVFVR